MTSPVLMSGVSALDRAIPVEQVSEIDSSEKTAILGTVWGHTLAQDGTGFYNELMAAMLAHDGADTEYKLQPYRRATTAFKNDQNTCLFPSARSVLSAAGGYDEAYVESDPLFLAQEYLFARNGHTPPSSLEDLKGKTVAVPHGSILFKLLAGAGAELISVHNETDKAQMLLSGRVDLMSGMLPNEHIIASELGTSMPSYDRTFPLLDAGVSVVCHDNAAGRDLIKRLNVVIAHLQADKSFRETLASAGVVESHALSAADLNSLAPAAGQKLRFVHPGRRLPFSNIR
ncbi:MAG: transporter substrate-binding domain-containing protein [Alphaproteobacteria bacterium]|nr:transporter substrate-binding domain-containing protein [Alphaproteobacteria bacterium]